MGCRYGCGDAEPADSGAFFFAQVYFEDCFDLCCLSSSSVLVRHGTGKLMTGYKTRKQMALLRSDRGRNLAQRLSVASLAESNLGKTRETSMGTRHTAIIHDSLKQECMCTKCTRQNGQRPRSCPSDHSIQPALGRGGHARAHISGKIHSYLVPMLRRVILPVKGILSPY